MSAGLQLRRLSRPVPIKFRPWSRSAHLDRIPRDRAAVVARMSAASDSEMLSVETRRFQFLSEPLCKAVGDLTGATKVESKR
jgi:hypothetical protein